MTIENNNLDNNTFEQQTDDNNYLISKRCTVPDMENILNKPFPVLDKGEIRLIEYMGSDSVIVNAARVSYGKGTKTARNDKALINYLLRNMHTSPFEMCELILYIKLPIFIAAQWIRHRTANINGYSARYSILKDEFYIPSPDQIKTQSNSNKQCSGEPLPSKKAEFISKQIYKHSINSYKLYEQMIEEGVSRELARMILPQNVYTYWYWKIDLHNLLHFLRLRTHPHAQSEIRDYANIILNEIVAKWVPYTYQAFCEHRMDSVTLSKTGKQIIHDHANNKLKPKEAYNTGNNEWQEVMQILKMV